MYKDNSQLSKKTKIKLFNSNVKSVLLHGCETCAMSEKHHKKIQTFVNKNLRKILKIYWPNKITNS